GGRLLGGEASTDRHDVVAPRDEDDLVRLRQIDAVAGALDETAQDDAAPVRGDRRVEEVDLAAARLHLDVLVAGRRMRGGAPEDRLARLEAFRLDVEPVLRAERAAVARQEHDVVLLDDRALGRLEPVVVERQRRLPGPREAEEEEPDVAELPVGP